jgi:Flp pilus assembly protein TadG
MLQPNLFERRRAYAYARQKVAALINALLRSESGSTLVEFAFSATILLTMVFGVIECSAAIYINNFVQNAAQQGVRYAMVRGSSWPGGDCASYSSFSCIASEADVTSFIQSSLPPGVQVANLQVTTTWPGTDPSGIGCDNIDGDNSPTCIVTVKVNYSFNFLIPFVRMNLATLSGTASQTIMQ